MYVSRCAGQVVVWAPAKLNLFLEVVARRPDGYHEIETLMTAIDIFDTLYFAVEQTEIRLTAGWVTGQRGREVGCHRRPTSACGDLPHGRDNIVVRAVELLRNRAGIDMGARMHLVKRIPSAAGLGGASSDAGAALVAANIGWGLNWSTSRLVALASELGSDVPFFVHSGTAVCRGRGEQIECTPGFGRLDFVVVRPPEGLNTSSVYAGCSPAASPRSAQQLAARGRQGGRTAIGRLLYNRLQQAARELSPSVDRLRGEYERLDLPGHQMSGSGTGYFGICRHSRHARRTAELLRSRQMGVVFCAASTSADRHVRRWAGQYEGEGP